MPRAEEWNAIVEHLQTAERRKAGIRPETLPKTRFYTTEDIPPYSLFPVLQGESTGNTMRSLYRVEKYSSANKSRYLNFYGTNGKYTISANSEFYGYVIDEFHDWILSITDFAEGAKKCGFKDGEFYASVDTEGLAVNGAAPFGENLHFVRRLSQEPSDFWVETDETLPANGRGNCNLLNNVTFNGESAMEVYAPPTGEIEAGTTGIAMWFSAERRWYFVPLGTSSEGQLINVYGRALHIEVIGDSGNPAFASQMNVFSDALEQTQVIAIEQSVQEVGD